MLVKIIKDWDFPDLMRQTPNCSKKWGNIVFTEDDVCECDLLVVLNGPMKDINIKCREAWLFSQEPPIEEHRKQIKYFGKFDKVFTFWGKDVCSNIWYDQTSLPWHVGKNYDQLKNMSVPDYKKRKNEISWITSNKEFTEGHKKRLNFLEHLKRTGFKFDLFGHGFLPVKDKYDAIYPYKYSIAVENFRCNDYWTEKIADCFLCFTMPIYFGASNITDYFPEESMIRINISDTEGAVKIINKAVNDNLWEENIKNIIHARNLVIEKYQFFPHIVELMSKFSVQEKPMKGFNLLFEERKDRSKTELLKNSLLLWKKMIKVIKQNI